MNALNETTTQGDVEAIKRMIKEAEGRGFENEFDVEIARREVVRLEGVLQSS